MSFIEQESRQSTTGIEGITRLIIEDQSLPQELLTETPEIIVHRLLNDNSLLTENQKMFIEKYFDKLSE